MAKAQTITLGDLAPDPQNARKHTARNVGMIEAALREVGAGRSIVIDEENTVLAGNATIEAAAAAGIETVRVVEASGNEIIAVRRTGLTPKQKTRLALYDNRTAELATWDMPIVLDAQQTDPTMLTGLFTADEVAKLDKLTAFDAGKLPDAVAGDMSDNYILYVSFDTLAELQEAITALTRGQRSGEHTVKATDHSASIDGKAYLSHWREAL